jgi:hypothetical protein
MAKYYYLVAGLPNLSFDGGKPPYTVSGFRDELTGHLTKTDLSLLDILFLKIDNNNLLKQLQYPDYEPDEGGKIAVEELNVLITGLQKVIDGRKEYQTLKDEAAEKDEDHVYEKTKIPPPPPPFKNKNKRLPAYFVKFARMYLESAGNEEETVIPWEDRLSAMYYEYAMKRLNPFISSWFELNLNINNILTALTCRKYKLDRDIYIVGDTEISNKLRSSKARDFELTETLEYLPSVMRIAEETDLLQREMKTDLFKWEWLDRQIFINVFGIESVLTYMLKIEMLEHWTNLDKATGNKAFRQLVGAMKKGSKHTLEEFKRNNKK